MRTVIQGHFRHALDDLAFIDPSCQATTQYITGGDSITAPLAGNRHLDGVTIIPT